MCSAKVIEEGIISKVEKLTDNVFSLEIKVSEDFPEPEPFQFVSILYKDFQLRRPFSVAGYSKGTLRLIIKRAGRMTEQLLNANKGDKVSVLGPLGKAPDFSAFKRVLCVAGGAGIAPFLYFFEKEAELKDISLIYGVRTVDDAWYEDIFTELKGFLLVTEDGSSNYHGYPVDYILSVSQYFGPEAVVAVGPYAMLKSLKPILYQVNFPIYVSLESYMGCSLGACGSCAVKLSSGEFVKTCVEGPVFDLKELSIGEEE